ncbi:MULTISPECIES: hypothetical protein [Cupriavidus]
MAMSEGAVVFEDALFQLIQSRR